MASYNKFNAFVADLANKVHNFSSDTFKVLLTNTAPIATNSVKADITEIAAGAGYTSGGVALTLISSSQSGGVYKYIASAPNPTWTSSGSFATFRYVVLYNSTAPSGNLVGFWDFGSPVTLSSGTPFTITIDPTSGVWQST